MSAVRRQPPGADAEKKEFVAEDAYVVTIVAVANPVLRTLVASTYHDYCELENAEVMALDDAKRIWRQNPKNIDQMDKKGGSSAGADDTGGSTETVPDVSAYIGEVMLQDSEAFNAERHDWSERHKRALHIRGTAVVSYDRGRRTARVTGDWCTFSRSVCLRITGQLDDFDKSIRMTNVDTTRRSGEHGIELLPTPTLKGRQFYELMLEKGGMHRREAETHLLNFFKTSSESLQQKKQQKKKETPVAAASSSAWQAPKILNNRTHDNSLMTQRSLAPPTYAETNAARLKVLDEAQEREVVITELWDRITAERIDMRKFLETESVSLGLRMVLLSDQLDEIRQAYNSREVQLSCVARGVEYIRTVSELMRTKAHVLCFGQLRRSYGELNGMRTLSLLPDLPVLSYRQLMQRHYPGGQIDQVRRCAADIYGSIMRYEVWGDGRPPTDNSYPTSNMCTVFGLDESDHTAQFYHGKSRHERDDVPDPESSLRDANAMSSRGTFALPFDDIHAPRAGVVNEEVPPVEVHVDYETRMLLQADLSRLSDEYTTDEFVAALRWMCENGIVVRERFIGTGKFNAGKPVDAFFISSVHDAQRRFQTALLDMYERAIKQSMYRPPTAMCELSLYSIWSEMQILRQEWRAAYARTMKVMQDMRRAAAAQKAAAASATNVTVADIVEDFEADNDVPGAIASLITDLAKEIADQEQKIYARYKELELPFDDTEDAYADLRRGRWLSRMPLLRIREPPYQLDNGVPFAAEQIRAIKRAIVQPVTIITGRGGAGKSEIINYLCKLYPAEQILCVALQGRNGSDLTRRTGVRARTIHSVLLQEARYREAMYRARSYRNSATKARKAAGGRVGEEFAPEEVAGCSEVSELRAYIESRLESYPPVTSPFENVRMLVVEEMSLVDQGLFSQLIDLACNTKLGHFIERLVCVGDLDQLPAIGYGNVQSDLAHAMPHAVCQLMKNHRARGAELFELSQALAEHRYDLKMPPFDLGRSLKELRDPNGARVVCIRTQPTDVAEMVTRVYTALGAVENEAVRKTVQCIATTNAEVNTANETIRWLYFGQKRLEAARAKHAAKKAAKLQKVVKKPRKVGSSDSDSDSSDDDDDVFDEEAEKAIIMREMNLQIVPGDCIYLRDNGAREFKARNQSEPSRKREVFNGRKLWFYQAYNAPKKVSQLGCRCGYCPPPPENHPANWRQPCMERLDLVPEGRRCRLVRSETPASRFFEWHNHKLPPRRDAARRMVVFQEEDGDWIELDVHEMLSRRALYEYAHALTTHKMQGSQEDIIIYICTTARCYIDCHYPYTAIGRARDRCIILCTDEVFQECARRKATLRISTQWFHLFGAVRYLHSKYPASPIALADVYPRGECNSEQRWQVFESRRHKPDVEEEMAVDNEASSTENEDGEVSSSSSEEMQAAQPYSLSDSSDEEYESSSSSSSSSVKEKKRKREEPYYEIEE